MASTGAAGGTAGAAAAGAVRTVIRAMNPYWRPQRNERQAAKLYHRNLARAQGGTDGNGKPLYTPYTWNVVKGDLVQVTTTSRKRDKDNKGKHLKNADGSFVAEDWLGAQGVVLKVLRKQERIIVKGVNMRTRVAQVRTDGDNSGDCATDARTWPATLARVRAPTNAWRLAWTNEDCER